MKLDYLVIMLLIVSMSVLVIGTTYVSLTDTYDVPHSEQYSSTFDKFNSSYTVAEEMVDDVSGAAVQKDQVDWDLVRLVTAGVNAAKVVFIQALPLAFGMITSIGQFIPLNPVILDTMTAILLISAVFALVYLYFRFQNE